jgi:phosphonate transport system substrate-binding protein
MRYLTRLSFALSLAFSAMPLAHAADEPLIMGVFPRMTAAETTARFTPLAQHLGARLGRPVTVATAKDFPAFWRGVEEQRYDLVLYNQYHYIRSARTYHVIAHIKEFGRSTLAGVLYVRKDSGITQLEQLRGRTILFGGGEDAMISYIVPVYLMMQAGLKKDDFKARFAVSPLNSVIGVYRKQADAAGSGDAAIHQPPVKAAVNPEELVMLAASEQLLHLPWAVKRTIPADLRETIQTMLTTLESSDSGAAVLKAAELTGIGKAHDGDYEPHRKIARAVIGAF